MTDVVIVATAIKTNFWQEYYLNLKNNNASFHLVFTGNRIPSFKLPDNFTFLHSEEKPTACAQKSYDYAHENIKSKYIMHTADDLIFQDGYLDSLIAGYEKKEKIFKDQPLMVTQVSVAPNGTYDRMGLGDGEPVLGIGPLTTTENNNLIGGIDRRFNAVCWDMDRLYRFYSLGGIMVPLSEEECPVVRERPVKGGTNTNFAWTQNAAHDLGLFHQLWNKKSTDKEIYLNYFKGKNEFHKGSFNFIRSDKVLLFKDGDTDE